MDRYQIVDFLQPMGNNIVNIASVKLMKERNDIHFLWKLGGDRKKNLDLEIKSKDQPPDRTLYINNNRNWKQQLKTQVAFETTKKKKQI